MCVSCGIQKKQQISKLTNSNSDNHEEDKKAAGMIE